MNNNNHRTLQNNKTSHRKAKTLSPMIMHSNLSKTILLLLLFYICFVNIRINEVNSAPIHLVSDFPSFAFTLLGQSHSSQIIKTFPGFPSTATQHHHHSLPPPSSSSSSKDHSTSNNNDSDEDGDDFDSNISPLIITSNPNNNNLNQQDSTTPYVDVEANELLAEAIALKDDNDLSATTNNTNSSLLITNNLINLAKATLNNNRFHQSTTVRLANGQSYQFCNDSNDDTKKCNDENTICKLGACVCKPGFFSHPITGGYCQSIRGWLNNCDSDHQCQAFNVELICDTKSHERPFCDCAEGLYFDQENHTCLPCTKNTIISSSVDKLNSLNNNNSSTTTTTMPNSATNKTTTINKEVSFRLCKPIEFNLRTKYNKFKPQDPFTIDPESPYRGYSEPSGGIHFTSSNYQQATSADGQNLSDPLRIKTPIDVFIGATVLFTVFTVAWLILRKMVRDCRSILKSLRNPEFAVNNCNDPNFIIGSPLINNGPLTTTTSTTTNRNGITTANHHYFDTNAATNQAVARLFSNDSYGSHFTSIYQRDLAGVMVQHLAGNLSPSSTSHALALRPNGTSTGSLLGLTTSEQRNSPLYPIFARAQTRNAAAAAAAAQLILSPNHPAIAIIRAAAANNQQAFDTTQASLSSFYDPPPKYEEAIAQANPLSYMPPLSPPPPPSTTTTDNQVQITNEDNDEQEQQSTNIVENNICENENNNTSNEIHINQAVGYETDNSETSKAEENKVTDYNTNSSIRSRNSDDSVNNNNNHNNVSEITSN